MLKVIVLRLLPITADMEDQFVVDGHAGAAAVHAGVGLIAVRLMESFDLFSAFQAVPPVRRGVMLVLFRPFMVNEVQLYASGATL